MRLDIRIYFHKMEGVIIHPSTDQQWQWTGELKSEVYVAVPSIQRRKNEETALCSGSWAV